MLAHFLTVTTFWLRTQHEHVRIAAGAIGVGYHYEGVADRWVDLIAHKH